MKDIVIQNHSYAVLRGYGMPIHSEDDDEKYGDLVIQFNVKLPANREHAAQFIETFKWNENYSGDNFVIADYYEQWNEYLKGQHFEIFGLVKAPKWNGKMAEILDWNETKKRYEVKILDEAERYLSIKQENLRYPIKSNGIDNDGVQCKQQ